jgi:hypothetical protein
MFIRQPGATVGNLEELSHDPTSESADNEELLAHFLLRRDVTEEEVIFQLEQRHKQ